MNVEITDRSEWDERKEWNEGMERSRKAGHLFRQGFAPQLEIRISIQER